MASIASLAIGMAGLSKVSRERICVWLPIVATVLVFLPGLSNQFVWDDEVLIQDNESLRDIGNLPTQVKVDFWDSSVRTIRSSGFYRPVIKALYLIEYHLYAGHPVGFLATNLVVHLGCVFLVFRLIRRRLGVDSFLAITTASAATFLFATHPTKPESVSWISGSTDLWMTLFILLGFECWELRNRWRYSILAAISFLLAFLCKESAICVPAILLCDVILLSKDKRRTAELLRIGVVSAALVLGVALHVHFVPIRYAPGTDWGLAGIGERVAASLGLYLERAFLPWTATTQSGAFAMDSTGRFVIPAIHIYVGAFGLLAFAALLVATCFSGKRKELASWLLHFALPLAPVLNLLPLQYRYLVADRFMYWPSIGLFAAVAWCVARISKRSIQVLVVGACLCLAIAWSLIAETHVSHFHSNYSLWSYEYQLNPNNQFVSETFARTLWAEDNASAAMPVVLQAITLSKTAGDLARSSALYASIALETVPDTDSNRLMAIRHFLDEMEDLDREQVTLNDGHVNMAFVPPPEDRRRIREGKGFDIQRAIAHMRTNDLEGADAQLSRILARQPNQLSAWINATQVKVIREDWDAAEQLIRQADARFTKNVHLELLHRRIEESRTRIVAANGNEPEQSLARADVFLNFGLPGRALKIVSVLLDRYPNDSQVMLARGKIQAALQR